jgi:hypothetical protein
VGFAQQIRNIEAIELVLKPDLYRRSCGGNQGTCKTVIPRFEKEAVANRQSPGSKKQQQPGGIWTAENGSDSRAERVRVQAADDDSSSQAEIVRARVTQISGRKRAELVAASRRHAG